MIKILVVEDSEKDMKFYKSAFEKIEGIQVSYAFSGEEALTYTKQRDIDMFILDIELPGMSGLELASKIRNLSVYALTLIMFITGYEKNQLEAFRQFHCYDYIIKPFSSKEFKGKIVALINHLSLSKHQISRVKMLLYPSVDKELLIPINQIKYVEVLHRRCFLYTDLQEESFESNSIILKELLTEVDDPYFVQCHRSFAVNIRKIKEIERLSYRLWNISLQDSNDKLYVSSKYYDEIYEKLRTWIAERKE